MCYSLWYNAPMMLPAGILEAPLPGYRPATSSVHYTTSCNTQSSSPGGGQNICPKHVELVGIINKPLLLHLVSVYIIYIIACFIFNMWHLHIICEKYQPTLQRKRKEHSLEPSAFLYLCARLNDCPFISGA